MNKRYIDALQENPRKYYSIEILFGMNSDSIYLVRYCPHCSDKNRDSGIYVLWIPLPEFPYNVHLKWRKSDLLSSLYTIQEKIRVRPKG